MNRPVSWLPILGRLLVLVTLLAGFWWWLDESNELEVTRYRLGDAAAGSGVRVALVADLHVKPGQVAAQQSLDALGREPFDVLLLAGDMVDVRARLPDLEAYLGHLPAGGSRYAVPGNWEYWAGLSIDALRSLYGRHGVRLLVNEAEVVRVSGQTPFLLVGLDDFLAGHPDMVRALKGHEGWRGPMLIMAHTPHTQGLVLRGWKEEAGAGHWMVSGHTHGGQIRLFGQPLDRRSRQAPCLEGWCGHDLLPIYVSRGVGTSVIPLRLGARPEVAWFDWKVGTVVGRKNP